MWPWDESPEICSMLPPSTNHDVLLWLTLIISKAQNFNMDVASELASDRSHSNIEEFYAGKSVFITGASGFIGKQVLEKLLWSCGRVKAIYVLMRSSRRHSAKERLELIFSSQVKLSSQRYLKIYWRYSWSRFLETSIVCQLKNCKILYRIFAKVARIKVQ